MIELFAAFCYLTISFNGEAILNLKNIVKSRRALVGVGRSIFEFTELAGVYPYL